MNEFDETKANPSLAQSVYGAATSRAPPPYDGSRVSFQLAGPTSMYPSYPTTLGQMRIPFQSMMINAGYVSVQTACIRDYMVWSIVNIFLGGILFGLAALLLSIQTRARKEAGDLLGARRMSKITLLFNVFTTLISFVAAAFLIIYLVYFVSDPNWETLLTIIISLSRIKKFSRLCVRIWCLLSLPTCSTLCSENCARSNHYLRASSSDGRE